MSRGPAVSDCGITRRFVMAASVSNTLISSIMTGRTLLIESYDSVLMARITLPLSVPIMRMS